jgi:hypothetical protein
LVLLFGCSLALAPSVSVSVFGCSLSLTPSLSLVLSPSLSLA